MPHQCVHCSEIYPDASQELLLGCKCGSKFFYYIKQDKIEKLRQEIPDSLFEISKIDKERIEKDIREITGMDEELDKPVILDVESIRVLGPGKYEIDIINLFSKSRPIIYKLEEGKYIIDLSDTVKVGRDEIDKKIKDPDIKLKHEGNAEELVEESEKKN
jgi:predicted  nucleic acid-binding Zn-ribbon protein